MSCPYNFHYSSVSFFPTSQPTKNYTHLEDFSNEIFYEIFQYLDTYDVYKGFYSLNYRLQQLCNSIYPLKINLSLISKSNFEQYNRQFLIPHRHRIQTLSISNPFLVDPFFSPIKLVTHLIQLETLFLNEVKPKYFSNMFRYLASLNNLSTLIIHSNCLSENIVESIFRLPKLKYCKLKFLKNDNLKIPSDKNISSSIEDFVIDGDFDSKDFINLSLYVPHLKTLFIQSLKPTYYQNLDSTDVPKFTHLKKVQIDRVVINFNIFEWICKYFFNQLEILHISIDYNDEMYLNARRWEQLISNSMPKLHAFDFRYDARLDTNNDEDAHPTYRMIQDDFSTPFWYQREWFFDYRFYYLYGNKVMFYSTNSHRLTVSLFYTFN